MDLRAIRDRIAAQHPAGIQGHARPPGSIATFPCYVVGDPTSIDYRSTMGGRIVVTLPIRVIVARFAEQDNSGALDDLVSDIPDQLEAITPDPAGLWQPRGLYIEQLTGGYFDYQQGRELVGIAADLTAHVHI